MSRLLATMLTIGVILSIARPGPTLAVAVTVPDAFTTVQEGIDSGADTVFVRDGDYPETPTCINPIVLLGIGDRRPRLEGLTFRNQGDPTVENVWVVRRMEFTQRLDAIFGPYWHPRHNQLHLSDCTLRSGFQTFIEDVFDLDSLTVRNCVIEGPSRAVAAHAWMDADTLDAGTWLHVLYGLRVAECWFRGGGGEALALHNDAPLAGVIERNRITDFDVGLWVDADEGLVLQDNDISRCGTGIFLDGGRTGGLIARRNRITSCGTGITASADEMYLQDNVVLDAQGSGMFVDSDYEPAVVERNVVGRCGGAGIVGQVGLWGIDVRNNTVFANGGSGIELSNRGGASVTVQGNIASGNGGWGLETDAPVQLGCNDWFENALGPVKGTTPDPTDMAVAPLFCDVANADVSLASTSPLLDASGCGRVGALGQGCAATAVLLTLLEARSTPEGIVIEWRWGGGEPAPDVGIERAEAVAGPWSRISTHRRSAGPTTIDRDFGTEPGRTYFYRLVWVDAAHQRQESAIATATAVGPTRLARVVIAPNPSSGPVEIVWSLPRAGLVRLAVYDLAGRRVTQVRSGYVPAGVHRSSWDGWTLAGPVAPGIYLVRLSCAGEEVTARVLLRR